MNQKEPVTINDLCDDMIKEIFSWLSPNELLKVGAINQTFRRCSDQVLSSIEVLRLDGQETGFCDDRVRRLTCTHLENEIEGRRITLAMSYLNVGFKTREELKRHRVEVLKRLAIKCPNIKCLVLVEVLFLDIHKLVKVLKQFKNLECFYVEPTQFIGDQPDQLEPIDQQKWQDFCEWFCPKLIHFNVFVWPDIPALTVDQMRLFVAKSSNLKSVGVELFLYDLDPDLVEGLNRFLLMLGDFPEKVNFHLIIGHFPDQPHLLANEQLKNFINNRVGRIEVGHRDMQLMVDRRSNATNMMVFSNGDDEELVTGEQHANHHSNPNALTKVENLQLMFRSFAGVSNLTSSFQFPNVESLVLHYNYTDDQLLHLFQHFQHIKSLSILPRDRRVFLLNLDPSTWIKVLKKLERFTLSCRMSNFNHHYSVWITYKLIAPLLANQSLKRIDIEMFVTSEVVVDSLTDFVNWLVLQFNKRVDVVSKIVLLLNKNFAKELQHLRTLVEDECRKFGRRRKLMVMVLLEQRQFDSFDDFRDHRTVLMK